MSQQANVMPVPSISFRTEDLPPHARDRVETLAAELARLELQSSVHLSAMSTVPTFQRQVRVWCKMCRLILTSVSFLLCLCSRDTWRKWAIQSTSGTSASLFSATATCCHTTLKSRRTQIPFK
jgi:hypothetical protein